METENYIPIAAWGKDHWSTLAYVESVMVDCAGFEIGSDARMRSNRRHFRVMQEECPRPKRFGRGAMGLSMSPGAGSRLKDGSVVTSHDDWCCVQDMAAEGLFKESADDVAPRTTLHLSEKGQALVEKLRQHKANGGTFSNFVA